MLSLPMYTPPRSEYNTNRQHNLALSTHTDRVSAQGLNLHCAINAEFVLSLFICIPQTDWLPIDLQKS